MIAKLKPSLQGLEDKVKTIYQTVEQKIQIQKVRTEDVYRINLGSLTNNRISSKREKRKQKKIIKERELSKK